MTSQAESRSFLLLVVMAGISICSGIQFHLNITILQNKPYIYKNGDRFEGTLVQLLNNFKVNLKGVCGPQGLTYNYGPTAKTYLELITAMRSNEEPASNFTINAFAPILPIYVDHNIYYRHDVSTILKSPGYTLVGSATTQTKLYRLFSFGFYDSVTLFVVLILVTSSFGILMWLLERRKTAKDPHFSYYILPGILDGFWWASVTMTTVGYGDKVPKTFLGRQVGMVWLIITVILLASFGAIMTSSITTETVSIAGRKVAYIENTSAIDIIYETAAEPVATKTYEEAWELARNMDVYGALLDTNYVSSMQDELHDENVLIDQRFHGDDEMKIAIWIRKHDNYSAELNSCFQALSKSFKDMEGKLLHLQPKLKSNRFRTLSEKLKPSRLILLDIVMVYITFGCMIMIAFIVGIIDYMRQRSSKRVAQTEKPSNTGKKELLSNLYKQLDKINSEMEEMKSMIQEFEGLPMKTIEKKEENIAKSSSMHFQMGENKGSHDGYTKQREHKF